MSSFSDMNSVWGTPKQIQVEEPPQSMRGGVVVNDFHKDIENLLNKNKIDNSLPLENREFTMEFPITIRMNGLIYLIMTSLPQIITNDICSPDDFGTLIMVNLCMT